MESLIAAAYGTIRGVTPTIAFVATLMALIDFARGKHERANFLMLWAIWTVISWGFIK